MTISKYETKLVLYKSAYLNSSYIIWSVDVGQH